MKIRPLVAVKTIIALSFCLLLLLVAASIAAQTRTKTRKPKVQTARVTITEYGYSRPSIVLGRGVLTRITFLRQTDSTCAKEVAIPEYGINRVLPLNTTVAVTFTPKRSGEFCFYMRNEHAPRETDSAIGTCFSNLQKLSCVWQSH